MSAVEWRPVNGYEARYQVSETGHVRNAVTHRVLSPMRTGTRRPGSQRSKVRFSTHPRIDVEVGGIVLTAFVGPRPEGCQVLHGNDDSADNCVANLRWGTLSDNMVDMVTRHRGGSQKLGPAEVLAIASRRTSGETGASLSREFGVSQQRICDIFKGRTCLNK